MYVVRINNVLIHVRGQTIFIFDAFGDLSEVEIRAMKNYLVDEGFLDKVINVFIKTKSFLQARSKKEN